MSKVKDEYERLLDELPRQERFNALLSAMHSFLREKGILTQEFDGYIVESMKGKLHRLKKENGL